MSNANRQSLGAFLFCGVVVTSGIVSLTACDALAGHKIAGSCDWRPAGGDRCFEYPEAAAKKDCTATGRVWKDGPCDHTGAACGSRLPGGIQKWIFATATTTKEKATTECSSLGTALGPDGKPAK